MKKRLTVTIGIPAHNEAVNIGNLLSSVRKQKGNNFTIEKIVVVCSGCTDDTAKIARSAGAHVIEQKKRDGKMSALNQIYSMNKSDILITLDADYVIAENHAIEKIINVFKDPTVGIAVFHIEPVVSDSVIGNISRAADLFWIESRIHVNDGDHPHNLQGGSTAMRKIVAQTVRYPADLNTDEGYLYIKAKQLGAFRYVHEAKILYRAPDTLHDFWSLSSRAIFYRRYKATKYLGKNLDSLYEIPLKYKMLGMAKTFIRSPFYTSGAVVLNVLVRVFPRRDNGVRSKKWEMAQSARKAIVL
ncbi:hypothetical protein A2875_05095 [Candidatus Gottesmanbacteria bacterium RIFCSPHIGHO2_01_FULL_46_14]|uniref:Glycosyltransferase 2-like domain-containing protein n=2 Tax=Candidatus Gottesmaniibacteriota TaxID=1752720 RepID=A0A1F5ZQU5_9BACT|nr:MAG: hypothetical protein A2875_05095 [Candidatus Gottesmanbacteria bacterium RIFCSPHIGHO2_01_FULL_46_14]OGG29962.1 MAG: hypothetical protein A2971_04385 [Candidatus Gottesmanbacteria bacterium RIFCSPLOWO2_01_FULL_46_21]